MFKRLMILGIAGLAFILGANYLLVYTLNKQVTRERERQDLTYWRTFNAIEQFGAHPDKGPDHAAKPALDETHQKALPKLLSTILQNYSHHLHHHSQAT